MSKSAIFYLASPYTHSESYIREYRYEKTLDLTTTLLGAGLKVFSPVIYGRGLEENGLPKSFDFWRPFDLEILSRCDYLLVYQLDGWQISKGVQAEIEFSQENDIPIIYIDDVEEDDTGGNLLSLEHYPDKHINTVYARD